jgi:hypothetical protein
MLLHELQHYSFGACGTVDLQRKEMPKELQAAKMKKGIVLWCCNGPGTGFLTRLVAMVGKKAFGGYRLLGDCRPTIEYSGNRGLEVERLPRFIVYEGNRRRRDLILHALDDRDSSNV